MLVTIHSAAIHGLQAQPIEVQVDVSPGFPSFTIVGLADTTIQESRERIRTALKQSGATVPDTKVIINLAPADIPKAGPSYDLPIALAILAATGQIQGLNDKRYIAIGELTLDGTIRSVRGVLSIAMLAQQAGFTDIIVPQDNAREAALVPGITIRSANTLQQVIKHFQITPSHTSNSILPIQPHESPTAKSLKNSDYDFADIKGHQAIKRALEVAAAGHHHSMLYGPPGSGKTFLAKALISILPSLNVQEMLELTALYSIAGELSVNDSYIRSRPFRHPHHSASMASLVGGGRLPRPGEISLAHHGILYLDELPEFSRAAIEALRQPLEDHTITVSRVQNSITYPARCMLLGSLNPCPCGYYGDEVKECICTPQQIAYYQKKLSGPLLDRIDIFCYVPRINFDTLQNISSDNESSQVIAQRVQQARDIQQDRYQAVGIQANAYIQPRQIEKYCQLNNEGKQLLKNAMQRLNLSPRSYHRILRVARTIADLESAEYITVQHLSEALQYRQTEKLYGA